MKRIHLLFLCACSLRAAGGVKIWSGGDLKSSADKLLQDGGSKGIVGRTFGAASLWHRSQSGEAELHKLKTDLIVIEEGSATLVFGGSIPDARTTAPNEVRGKSIVNGESRKLGPGDILRIPAGTPHQFVLEKGQRIAYFALSSRANQCSVSEVGTRIRRQDAWVVEPDALHSISGPPVRYIAGLFRRSPGSMMSRIGDFAFLGFRFGGLGV